MKSEEYKGLKSILIETGELYLFAQKFFRELFKKPFEGREFLRQCYNVGNKSILLVVITGFIIGDVYKRQLLLGLVIWIQIMTQGEILVMLIAQ